MVRHVEDTRNDDMMECEIGRWAHEDIACFWRSFPRVATHSRESKNSSCWAFASGVSWDALCFCLGTCWEEFGGAHWLVVTRSRYGIVSRVLQTSVYRNTY